MKAPMAGEKTADKAVRRTRGGMNTKLHAMLHSIVDGFGNPVEFLLPARNDHDSVHAVKLLSKVDISKSVVLADRAYSARAIREYISNQGSTYVIPPKSNSINPWPIDRHLYKEHLLIECFLPKIKWFRRIATRYEKLDMSFTAFVHLASIAILLL